MIKSIIFLLFGITFIKSRITDIPIYISDYDKFKEIGDDINIQQILERMRNLYYYTEIYVGSNN